MSAPVDVLAVMSAAFSYIRAETEDEGALAESVLRARTAVAELIEASSAYLDRNNQWDDDEEPETSDAAKSRNEHVRMWKRVAAALANAGPRRRSQLAYLIQEQAKAEAKLAGGAR